MSQRFTIHRLALTAIFAVVLSRVDAADANLPLEAPVKRLAAPSPTAPSTSMPMPRAAAAGPTTPGGKLPQYQLGRQQLVLPTGDELQSPRRRFQLLLPQGQLVIETTITIDGLPFQMVRERRIDQLIADAATETSSPKEPADTEETPAAPPYSLPTSATERLRRYVQAIGRPASREEVRWLLTNWVDGPTMLLLNDNFQRFRADQQPAIAILDRDRDGTISAAELQQAVQSFQECDLNRDEIVQFTEIAKAAVDPRRQARHAGPGKLITTSPQAAAAPPALSLSIAFDTAHPENSRIAVTQAAPEFADAVKHARVEASIIALKLNGTPVWFQAVQMESADQVSIGAVNDGYPLLPELDPNDDGQLTIRELRGLAERLLTFDANKDGNLTTDEVQAPIRVSIGLGPIVHRELAGIRSVHSELQTPPVKGPEWFVRMDRNKDNDLTRGEFPGADEQFSALDADADQLISAAEALSYDQNKLPATPRKSTEPQ